MNGRAFLVTGGAGYVGSHLVAHLADQGAEVVVLDNLRQGHAAAVPHGIRLVVGEAGDPSTLEEVFSRTRFDAVFHFASLSLVGESMQQPFRYLEENSLQALRLIEAACRHQVMRFVLSSTANLFAAPERLPIDESEAIDPGSPYGESKYIIERALVWADRVFGLRSAALRYFECGGGGSGGAAGRGSRPGNPSHSAADRRGFGAAATDHRLRLGLRHAGRHLHPRLRACLRPRYGAFGGARSAGDAQRHLQPRQRPWPFGAGGDRGGGAGERTGGSVGGEVARELAIHRALVASAAALSATPAGRLASRISTRSSRPPTAGGSTIRKVTRNRLSVFGAGCGVRRSLMPILA